MKNTTSRLKYHEQDKNKGTPISPIYEPYLIKQNTEEKVYNTLSGVESCQ